MPNPTEAIQTPALIEATTTQGEIEISSAHFHELIHHSVDAAGSAATTPIYFAFGAAGGVPPTVVASDAAGSNKLRLASGGRITIKPGVSLIGFKTASGAPMFSIVPLTRTLNA
ncbi:MAG: hypothetical protein IPK83_24240 [Planctomycetes bacterium]|nr:hypothetical protein [Planctomycetota bacterium]